jgi:hypothetical protein
MGIISESSNEKGQTHPDGNMVQMILNDFQLIRIFFQTGFAQTQNISSTTTFHITTILSHFTASLALKKRHWATDNGRAFEKFSFHASTLYCFFLSLYTTDHLQKNTSVQSATYFDF